MPFFRGGEVYEFIVEEGPMEESIAKIMLSQLLDGLERLQQLGIGHRDLSVENILYEIDYEKEIYRFVIIDFGMCVLCDRLDRYLHTDESELTAYSFKSLPMYDPCGKKQYMAPEILSGNSTTVNPMLCDMWALGIILFISLTGNFPMDLALITDPKYRFIAVDMRLADYFQHFQINISSDATNLIQNLLRPDPMQRLTIQQIRDHPWLNT
jgi:serine/threonine protein kinase